MAKDLYKGKRRAASRAAVPSPPEPVPGLIGVVVEQTVVPQQAVPPQKTPAAFSVDWSLQMLPPRQSYTDMPADDPFWAKLAKLVKEINGD
jgi:hypothetical protein